MIGKYKFGRRSAESPRKNINPLESTSKFSQVPTFAEPVTRTHSNISAICKGECLRPLGHPMPFINGWGGVPCKDERKAMSRRTDIGQRSEGTRHAHSASDNVRFDSFIDWRGPIEKEALVDAGFFYIGEEDAVQCFSCELVIRNWTKGMDPLVEHVKRAPGCEYLTKLMSAGDLAEMKEQLFDVTKMRAPTDGAFTWPCNNVTGERVDEEVHDCMCIRASQQSVEQHTEPDPDNEESDRDAIRSVDMFSNGSEVRENCVQIGASGDGRRVAEREPHPDIGMRVENIPPRGELYQDAGTHGVNGDDNLDRMMQSIAAQSVLQTGYGTEDDVRNAIIDLRRNGKEDFNGVDIMRLILGTGTYSN